MPMISVEFNEGLLYLLTPSRVAISGADKPSWDMHQSV